MPTNQSTNQSVLFETIQFSMRTQSKTFLFQTIQFSIRTQSKTFLFQDIQFSKTLLNQTIQFSMSIIFVHIQLRITWMVLGRHEEDEQEMVLYFPSKTNDIYKRSFYKLFDGWNKVLGRIGVNTYY